MSKGGVTRPHGQLRQSQLLGTFGPGALLELPNHSVLVSGLDTWQQGEPIREPRLVESLQRQLGIPSLQLFAPPIDNGDWWQPAPGIRVWQFPDWYVSQQPETGVGGRGARSRRLVWRTQLQGGKYRGEDRKMHAVVPIRFVRACPRGHIGDIDWHRFAHRGPKPCRQPLWLDERGTSGDISEIWVRCECGDSRPLFEAYRAPNLGYCEGNRPWLGRYSREDCDQPNRLLTRTASNAYFPQVLSVISLPEPDNPLAEPVGQLSLEIIQNVRDGAGLATIAPYMPSVAALVAQFGAASVLAELERRRTGSSGPSKPVRHAELETLAAVRDDSARRVGDATFMAEAWPRERWAAEQGMAAVGHVVLVHRLREVVAQLGFTRFEALTTDENGELEEDTQLRSARLATEAAWLPAIENRGEGIFLSLRPEAVVAWLARPAVKKRGDQLGQGFERWKDQHPGSGLKFRGLPYLLLHSLSHMLVTAIALDCGYPASAIRERIYALPEVGYGILLYTATSDAEGTLGGLVDAGRRLPQYLAAACDLGRLCSNDPVCAQHRPHDANIQRFLHGAACHGCLLIAETSCEARNEFLDRALVVPTVVDREAAFFL